MRIANQFYSIQGEGSLSGLPMYFVRLSGCSVSHCPLHPANDNTCDTDWQNKETVAVESLAETAKGSGAKWVCITGGEPTDQLSDVIELTSLIRRNGQRVMLQTSGVRSVPECFDWLVVSPKDHFLKINQVSGHELKLVWYGQDYGYLMAIATQTRFLDYFLQPLFLPDGSTNIAEVASVVLTCGKIGIPFRMSVQQHKLWGGE